MFHRNKCSAVASGIGRHLDAHYGDDLPRSLMQTVFRTEHLSLGFGDRQLFSELSMELQAGSSLAVVGANGSGKSTFVKTLLGLNTPLSGRIDWPLGYPSTVGYLAQLTEFDREFPIRVRDLVAMGRWPQLGLLGRLNPAARDQVEEAMELVGMSHLANRSLHRLSGGELQRTLFARVVLQDAPLIILDEPFAAVDQTTEAHLLTLIDAWREQGRAIVLVVHDLSSVLDHCTHALLLGAETATFGTVDEVLTPERLVAQRYMSESQAAWMFDAGRATRG